MAHHKRKGPKSTRDGCLLCKPHKRQGVDSPKRQEIRSRISEREQRQRAARLYLGALGAQEIGWNSYYLKSEEDEGE